MPRMRNAISGKARFLSRRRRVKKNAELDNFRQMDGKPLEKQLKGAAKKQQVKLRINKRFELKRVA